MSTLVVVESYFGNTWKIGEAIAAALPDAALVRVDEAPQQVDTTIDLLILGAPTHAFTLPTADSRREAAKRRTAGSMSAQERRFHPSTTGLREWIHAASVPETTRIITFDTCVKGAGPLFGRASKKAVKVLNSTHPSANRGETFWVSAADELHEGEIARAAAWAGEL
ncbi:hypothetical protein VR010_10900 [Actinomycetaceae bacterium L2_0104]